MPLAWTARLGLLSVLLVFGSCMWILGSRAIGRLAERGWESETSNVAADAQVVNWENASLAAKAGS
jgi:hypothetical protein